MLSEIHEALQHLLYDRGRIPAREVDIRFEAPTKDWIDGLTRPTLNLFLVDVSENTDLRRTDFQTTRGNGQATRRLPPRRFDLNYVVSAITTEIDDEHRLLWRALVTLGKHKEIPADLLSEELRSFEMPLSTRVLPAGEGPRLPDLWSALGTPPRPSLAYAVTAPVDLEVAIDAPLVLTSMTRFRQVSPGGTIDTAINVGGVVRDREGQPVEGVTVTREGSAAAGSVTNRDGWFVLHDVPSGTLTLRAEPGEGPETTVTVDVPSESYDITLR